MPDEERHGRELEEDHDLLTFNESAARLRQEVEETRAALDGLPGEDPTTHQLQHRLDALLASQAHIVAQAEQNAQGRRFADYRPQH